MREARVEIHSKVRHSIVLRFMPVCRVAVDSKSMMGVFSSEANEPLAIIAPMTPPVPMRDNKHHIGARKTTQMPRKLPLDFQL